MIVHEAAQGTPAWLRARAGVVSASRLGVLVTSTGKVSKSKGVETYLHELVAEIILGGPLDNDVGSGWVSRGTDMEPQARAHYALVTDTEPEEVGFCLRDDKRVGFSPDALIGEDGGLELKVPACRTHVGYALEPDTLVAAYRYQVQGALWISGREWWDLMSFNPVIEPVLVRCKPDLEYHSALDEAVTPFIERIDKAVDRLRVLSIDGDPDDELTQAAAEIFG